MRGFLDRSSCNMFYVKFMLFTKYKTLRQSVRSNVPWSCLWRILEKDHESDISIIPVWPPAVTSGVSTPVSSPRGGGGREMCPDHQLLAAACWHWSIPGSTLQHHGRPHLPHVSIIAFPLVQSIQLSFCHKSGCPWLTPRT